MRAPADAADSATAETRAETVGAAPEVRALWVVRTSLVHPDSARVAVRRAHEAGFNTLLVQVRGRGDAWYDSRLEPRAEALADADLDYDPLQVVLDEARPRRMRVHAWVNVHLVAGTLGPHVAAAHVAHRRPDLLAVPRELARRLFEIDPKEGEYLERLTAHARENRSRLEGLYTSPLQPAARSQVAEVVGELVESYDVDGVHLDYLRLPSPAFDYGRGALEAFRAWIRGEASTGGVEVRWRAGDPFAYVDAFPEEWDAFRREAVTATLERIVARIRSRRPDMPVTAAVFPDPDEARAERFQPWREWMARGLLHAVAPMAYTSDDEVFRRVLGEALGAAGPQRVWIGVGAYTNTVEGAVEKAQAAVAAGVAGVVLFSYDWAVGPEGRAAAGGDYLGVFGRSVFMPRTGSPPFAR